MDIIGELLEAFAVLLVILGVHTIKHSDLEVGAPLAFIRSSLGFASERSRWAYLRSGI